IVLWRFAPAYSVEAIESDLARLRALYFANGYFGPVVRLDDVEISGSEARIRIFAQSGPQYWSRQRTAGLCAGLFARRREAERRGILDFSAKLDVASGQAISLPHMAYRLGRIEFAGLSHYQDATVRRAFLLDEGDLLDMTLLRRSLARPDRTERFDPIRQSDFATRRNER